MVKSMYERALASLNHNDPENKSFTKDYSSVSILPAFDVMNTPDQAPKTGICINCNKPVETPYCPQCGQPHPPLRISLSQISADIQGRAYGTSGLFQRTLRDLLVKPGGVVATYIRGNRVMYSRPVGYFLLMITILLVLISLLNFDYAAFMQAGTPGSDMQNTAQSKLQQDVYRFMMNNFRLMAFIVIPVQAFFARWFFFRKSGFTYIEHTVLPFYTSAQLNIITIFSILLFEITGWHTPFWIISVVSMGYFACAYVGWIQTQSKLKVFLKGIAIYIIAVFAISVLAMMGGVIYFILHPEVLKSFSQQPGG